MRTSLALFSVTVALGTAVEASPLNFAALFARNNDGKASEGRHDQCVQVVSQKEGKCVSPADDRVSEGSSVTLVDCDKAASWRVSGDDKSCGPITLCDDSGLALDAGRDVSRGGKLSLYNANGSPQQDFCVNDDGTISVGRDQCLDIGNGLQVYTCDARNDNQQFKAEPVEQRDQGKEGADKQQDDKKDDGRQQEGQKDDDRQQDDKKDDGKKEEPKGENTRPAADATVTATEYKTQTEHAIETQKQNETVFATKTEQAPVETVKETETVYLTKTEKDLETKTANFTDIKTQTETFLQDIPTTRTEVKTQTVTETPKPVTETKTEVKTETKNVTFTETPKPVTETQFVTETPKPVTETKNVTITETPKPVTETKVETQKITETPKPITKTETKYETKYETVKETQTERQEAQPTKDAGRDEHQKDEGKDYDRYYDDGRQEQGKEEERH